jgi:flagellar basal-body rod protein FlgB
MIHNLLFDHRSINLMKGGLDAGSARMRVISENVANVTTPGYEAKEVQFEEHITEARRSIELAETQKGHIPAEEGDVPAPLVRRTEGQTPEGAVNNVDMEQELVRMKQNEIHYQALSQLLARKYKGIQDAIR